MVENQLLFEIIKTIFPFLFLGIVLFLLFFVKFLTDDMFTLRFSELHLDKQNLQKEFSVRFSSVYFASVLPKNVIDIAFTSIKLKGFYVRLYFYSNFLVAKFFDRAMVINDISKIALTDVFIGRMFVQAAKSKGVSFALSANQYKQIKQWVEQQKNMQ